MSQDRNPASTNPADAGKGLRLQMLKLKAEAIGIKPSSDFPQVFGVAMNWPIGNGQVASVVSLADGNASLYTTSTFGIIGGFAHEPVRTTSKKFVQAAGQFVNDSVPANDYPYPGEGHVKFYLLTFQGVRVIDADLASISTGKGKFSNLFGSGQEVLSELRAITEKK